MAEHENGEAHEAENSKLDEEQEEGDEGDGVSGEELGGQVGESRPAEVVSCLGAGEVKVKGSGLETLERPTALQSSSVNGQSEGLLEISASQSAGVPGVKDQDGVSRDEVSFCATSQAAQAQTQSQLQLSNCVTPPSQQSPTSVTQSISSAPSPTLLEQRKLPPLKIIKECKPVPNPLKSSKTTPSLPTVRTPSSDGYNWRKYGQKQVKSPKGSRSYYRCTHAECCAKKIECCDHSGHVTEIVYKSQHSHTPPRKINSSRESKVVSSAEPVVRNIITEHSNRIINDSDPSTSSKEHVQDTTSVPERKRQYSSDLVVNVENIVKEENNANEPEPKRREKKSNVEYPDSIVKVGKKPKFVVHAAGDVGISGDGYRWRKYGQKMVKGNSHPRNYYRCTSAGCPVRKHIETAIDNPNAVIITYKGIHDHDKPVPKKRHGPPSASLVAVAAPTSMNNIQTKKTDTASTQWSVDPEGELTGEALDLGGEKAMESARTLLSIGFEIKPC